ncbi:60S ribosomal protein L14 [Trichoplax sp. H2]|uniref:Large ribosomal subunit protein eL14 n=1 Tax=Trichoplax adhaerens TaxID=10228 RepID=B3RVP0_TRIAD|nr:expressed hypothetical protein [Trichoplax adhaerens]EDV25533.1 expressed hypothetical protein [Trichoplax adhaerens]RDD46925.1 60S ribosomal protein L14 [Trichoplax sp. H2]|eukprot:XP_002111566.1 expressed hypothetical protein [Trichoplax adhaerens]
MVFTRFVEIGRVVLVNTGPDAGKLCVIVDVIDQRRALVDGPSTNVKRQAMNFSNMSLTTFVLPKLAHSVHSKKVRQAFDSEKILEKWNETAWAKKLRTRTVRRNLTDFDRFKVKRAKQKKARLINGEVKKRRRASKQ